jgi:hypothetical protein
MPDDAKPDEKPAELTLEYTPSGRNGRATVTAKLAGETLAVETFSLTKSKARADFARALADGRPGIDTAAVGAELLRLAADLASRREPSAPDWGTLPELDSARVIRPEAFFLDEVAGLAVPTLSAIGEKVTGRWVWYLRHADGNRDRRLVGSVLDLDGGRRYWVSPEPPEPSATTWVGWSAASRRAWVEGAEPPDPAELFSRLAQQIASFVDFPSHSGPGTIGTMTLWAMLSYTTPLWEAVPYLLFRGAQGSGKSRALDVLARLVYRPVVASSLTGPTLFRVVHSQGGTMLFEEAESLRRSQDPAAAEVLAALLSGYRRGGCCLRLEPVGDSFRPVSFSTFGPKALGAINNVPEPLAARSITVGMIRNAPGSPRASRKLDGDRVTWQALRDDLHRAALDFAPEWRQAAALDLCPPVMAGRDKEKWGPLLAVASVIQSHGADGLVSLLTEHALQTVGDSQTDSTPGCDEVLLRALADEVRWGRRPSPKDVLTRAVEAEPNAFKNWTERAVTSHLGRYGVPTPRKIHGRRIFRDVTPELLRGIEERYGVDLGCDEDEGTEN